MRAQKRDQERNIEVKNVQWQANKFQLTIQTQTYKRMKEKWQTNE